MAVVQRNVSTSGEWLAAARVAVSGRSVERTLGGRFADTFNVLDFGAQPNDPAFDNRASIQAALDAAFAAGGGVVTIPTGTYWMTGTGTASHGCVQVKSNVSVVGAGMGLAVLKLADGYNQDLTGVLRTPSGQETDRVAVQDLTLDANGPGQTAGTQMAFFCGTSPDDPVTTRCEDIRLTRVEATGGRSTSGYGFDPHENVLRLSLIDCLAHDNELDGFVLDGCREVVVNGCRSWSNTRHGFNVVTWSSDVVLTACQAVGNSENGIIVQNGGQHVAIRDCIVRSNGQEGVKIRGEDAYTHDNFVSVVGCQIRENGQRGIAIVGSSHNHIANNLLLNNSASLDNGYDDINLTLYETGPASYNDVLFNICKNTTLDKRTRYNIREESTAGYCANNYFVGNRCSGAVNGTPQSYNGTNTVVFGLKEPDFYFGRASSNRFYLEDSGRLRWGSANTATAVGAAGAAAAPPASPQIYLEVEDSAQNRLLVPAYLKAT